MSEKYMQVPVSLIERLYAGEDVVDELHDLVPHRDSQPTPTAEASCECEHTSFDHGHSEGDGCLHCPCKEFTPAPPSIADMVPGTTFMARHVRGFWDQFSVECGSLRRQGRGTCGADEIDPSTVRDVTPPADAS